MNTFQIKKYISLLLLFFPVFQLFAQNITDSIHPLFKGKINGDEIRQVFTNYEAPKTAGSRIILGLFHSNKLFNSDGLYSINTTDERYEIINKFRQNLASYAPENKTVYPAIVPLYDSSSIIVTVSGINHSNAHEFEFRIMKNIKEQALPWKPVKFFCEPYTYHSNSDGSEQTEDAYLGEFKTTFGNSLTIEVRKKSDTLNFYSISALWINKFPKIIGTFSSNEMPTFLSVFKQQWKNDFSQGASTYYEDNSNINVDSLLKTRQKFSSNENSIIFYLYDKVKSKEIIEYNLLTGKRNSEWKSNDFDMNFIWLKDLQPGKYTLQIRYSIQRHNISEYKFTIQAAWHQTLIFKITLFILVLIVLAFILLTLKSKRLKRKMKMTQLQKQETEAELKSLRSQFNPHFVFNALSSIQGLITNNNMDAANKYLTEFSSLLRESLKESSKELTNLSSEIKLLDSYLKLEQLRVRFSYIINIEPAINENAVEIPSLLLQPIVENAVKHGVASLYEKGSLAINIKRSAADIVITITDNGKGFDTDKITSGYGLKLTKERISLLNKTLKNRRIELIVKSPANGTTIDFVFKNWQL